MLSLLLPALQDTTLLPDELFGVPDPAYDAYVGQKHPAHAGPLPEAYSLEKDPCVLFHQQDQGSCGSCWAAATAGVLGMRRCLRFGEKRKISMQEFVSCDHMSAYGVTDSGCNGGHPLVAMSYSASVGAVYNDCYNYTSYQTYYPYPPTTCKATCDNGAAKTRVKNGPARRLIGEAAMMQEIFTNGPIAVGFKVYSDFNNQTLNDGIYTGSKTGVSWGGHAVIIIGWGVRNGIKYWIVQNTWGSSWHGNGLFKFIRGQNMNSIENEGAACDPIGGTPILQAGTLSFVSTLLQNQNVSVSYANFSTACNLTVNGVFAAAIPASSSGNVTFLLKNATIGTATIACGSVNQTATVINYLPVFSAPQITGMSQTATTVTFSTKPGIQQILRWQNSSTQTLLGTFSIPQLTPGNYTLVLETVLTNPVVKTQATLVIPAPLWSISVQPAQIAKIGQNVSVVLSTTFMTQFVVQIVDSTTQRVISTPANPWVCLGDFSKAVEATFNFIATNSGSFFFKFIAGNITLSSQVFQITSSDVAEKIVSPVEGQVYLQNNFVSFIANGLENQTVYVDGIASGVIKGGQLSINFTVVKNVTITVGKQICHLTVIPSPRFDMTVYSVPLGTNYVIKLANDGAAFVFDKFVTILFKNAPLTVVNNSVVVSSTVGETQQITLKTLNSTPALTQTATVNFIGATPQPAMPPTQPLKGYYPTPTTMLPAGQNVTVRWVTNLSASLNVTMLLMKGLPGNYTYVLTLSTAAPNTGSFTFTLPATLAPGPFCIILYTSSGLVRYSDTIVFAVATKLSISSSLFVENILTAEATDEAEFFLMRNDGQAVRAFGKMQKLELELTEPGQFFLRACSAGSCADGPTFDVQEKN